MLKSIHLLLIPLVLAVAFPATAKTVRGDAGGRIDGSGKQDHEPTSPAIPAPSTPASLKQEPKPAVYEYHCNPSPDKESADACVQRDSAEAAKASADAAYSQVTWSKVAAFIGLITAGFTYWAAIAARDAAIASKVSADEARRSNEQARKLFTAEHRPWIKITPLEAGPVSHVDGRTRASAKFAYENIGTIPATNVICDAQIIVMKNVFANRDFLFKEIEIIKSGRDTPANDLILLPKDTHYFSISRTIEGVTNQRILSEVEFATDNKLMISVLMVVIYKSTIYDDWYVTAHVGVIMGEKDWSSGATVEQCSFKILGGEDILT